jgi:hypothetical protein
MHYDMNIILALEFRYGVPEIMPVAKITLTYKTEILIVQP